MDAFIHDGFWVLVGFLVGGGVAYIPLSKRISKVREDSVMKEECKELSDLRSAPITQSIKTLSKEVAEVKGDVKVVRDELRKISRYINGRDNQ